MSSRTTTRKIRTRNVPQANTLPLVVDIVALVSGGIRGRDALAQELHIAPREVDYYSHAARILGLIQGRINRPIITDAGNELLEAIDPDDRARLLAGAVRNTEVYSRLADALRPEEFSKDSITEFLRANTNLTGSTPARRATTILAWSRAVLEHDPEILRERVAVAAAAANTAAGRYGTGGEGDLHRRLKEAIAESPEIYLGEPMELIQTEFPFPTNDRADIVLEDTSQRLVAVEVKIDVEARDLPGLLQAAKYKIMLAIVLGLNPDDVRSILVARSIHADVLRSAERYSIETIEVPEFK